MEHNSLTIIDAPIKNFQKYGVPRIYVLDSIELHTIGCAQNTAEAIQQNFNRYNPDGAVHYIIAADTANKVLQLLPDHNTAWADGGYGNNHSITVEIAESDYMRYTGGANFIITDQVKFAGDLKRGYDTAVKFFAMKCRQYGINPTAKLTNGLYCVYSHAEANRKGLATAHVDPEHIWPKAGYTMDQFRSDVKSLMDQTFMTTNADGTYTVKKGDTLYSIAPKFNCTVKYLKRWNQLNTDLILPGQRLNLHYWVGMITASCPVKVSPGKHKKDLAAYPKLERGKLVEVLGSKRSPAGLKWYRVRITNSGQEACKGYIYSKNIQKQ